MKELSIKQWHQRGKIEQQDYLNGSKKWWIFIRSTIVVKIFNDRSRKNEENEC